MEPNKNLKGIALASMILGIAGLCIFILSILISILAPQWFSDRPLLTITLPIGFLTSVLGLVLGILAHKSTAKKFSIVGQVTGILGLILIACPLTELSNSIVDSFRRLVSSIHF